MALTRRISRHMTLAAATTKLITMILRMKPDEIMTTLKRFETNGFHDIRNEPREEYFGEVYYSTEDHAVNSFFTNISNGGMFIETREPLQRGQKITLTYNFPGTDKPVKMKGVITRMDGTGVGVAFDNDVRTAIRYNTKPTGNNRPKPV